MRNAYRAVVGKPGRKGSLKIIGLAASMILKRNLET
jgi:hypothetical protein